MSCNQGNTSLEKERERIKILQSYKIHDADLENRLNSFTDLASEICETPIALVQLLDGEHQIPKADTGWEIPVTPRKYSLGEYVLQQEGLVEIEDVSRDDRFKESPLVNLKPDIRFYAAVPLKTGRGFVLGVLCVIDTEARKLTDRQYKMLGMIADEVVSQLKYHREEQMREEERKKDRIFLRDSLTLRAIIEPHSLQIRDINSESVALLGGEKEDYIGNTFGTCVEDEQIRRDIECFLSQETVKRRQFNAPVKLEDGEIRYFELTFALHGSLWYLSARDRTDKYHYEKELRKRSEAMEASLDGIAIVEKGGSIRYLNKAHVELFGYKEKEKILNNSWHMLYPEKNADKLENDVLPVLLEKGEWRGESTGLRKDGSRFPVEISLRLISEDELVAVVRDISDRKETEQKLRETIDTLEHAQHIAKFGTWKWTIGSDKIQQSPEIYDIFEYDPETTEPTLQSYLDLIHPEDIEDVKAVLAQIRAGGEIQNMRHRIITPNGNLKYIHLRAISYISQEDGAPVIMGTTQDITEQVKIEKRLRKSLNEKEVLLSEVHHRVKNNLAVISGLLQLEAFQAEDEQVQHALTKSQMRIHSMAAIHENLYQQGDFDQVPFNAYIKEILQVVRDTFEEKSKAVSIKTSLEEVILNVNQAVPCGLILNELIVNAFKHAFEEQERGEIEIFLNRENNSVNIKVRDNGVGLPKDFELNKGSSLGLTLIHTLCKQLNARWKMNTENGAEFEIEFEKLQVKGSSSAFRLN